MKILICCFILLSIITLAGSLPFEPYPTILSTMNMESQKLLRLIRGGHVHAPEDLGIVDILISGKQIVGFLSAQQSDELSRTLGESLDVIDASGLIVTPGFVDAHVHVTGGGGEAGFRSRTPEAQVSELVNSGITTVIGVLGTDSVSRSLENLLAKVRGLEEEGLSGWMWTGAYRVPTPTLTGDLLKDITLIDKVIGAGEIAFSDHRSNNPAYPQLVAMASDLRVGGLLSGKAGKLYLHTGAGKKGLQPLWDAIQESDVPISQFLPTHVTSRGEALLKDVFRWVDAGGWADFTADTEGEGDTLTALLGTPHELLDRILVSSDAYGSFPKFDAQGEVIGYGYGLPTSLLKTLQSLVLRHQWDISAALKPFTLNAATCLKLVNKGHIALGKDADLLTLNPSNLTLQHVIANGRVMKDGDWVQKGMFEK
eukprot:TRINITY_DN18819_c0_g1::TRINITY_DN18819_c0_g1_i1::g.15251::m.15251 TRINITY_DN18819_c0_g1::TRINITY_DN18819_c0_g1_i1::g.15251  ORF type:complete len:426 (+),score=88.34,sp/P39377/IADA_ECOLI/45.24/3e-100,Amidohydro_1/PF01979.15/1.6e-06,Amidohydro_1/PF01979.15/0.00012,Amidohydro_5/PF13594.1/5.8e-13,Amidohydro_4/PF13147.1/2.2e-07,Amidohydro_4/PF13147.1/0.97,Amidohydro_3/PF07969.6/0.0061,Amidohydro_3/PF07969.6/2.1e+03,Amidohydro_3/PF07969.6/0.018 TRINITY_DN18819_c0_g1_i1:125-1402(+)